MVLENVTLPLVITTALVDSINPCAIGVMILLCTSLIKLVSNKVRMILVGGIYIVVVYVTYFLAGIGLLYTIHKLNIAPYVGLVVAFIVIIFGFIEIKDYFWYGKGFSLRINPRYAKTIEKYAYKGTIPAIIGLGILVAAVELPCTGGPYLAITTLLAKQFDTVAVLYLLLYNFIFVVPLLAVLGLAYFGVSHVSMKQWKKKYRKYMRLASGLIMLALGALLLWYYLRFLI